MLLYIFDTHIYISFVFFSSHFVILSMSTVVRWRGKNHVKIISYVNVSIKMDWFQSKANWIHLSLIFSWWETQFLFHHLIKLRLRDRPNQWGKKGELNWQIRLLPLLLLRLWLPIFFYFCTLINSLRFNAVWLKVHQIYHEYENE